MTESAPVAYDSVPTSTSLSLGLHHVQLAIPVGGESRAREFYVDILGMTEVAKPPVLAARGGLWVRADALEIHLGVEQDFQPARKAHPGILVADVDALQERFHRHGVETQRDDDFPGHNRFYVYDCFGNRLEFLQPQSETHD